MVEVEVVVNDTRRVIPLLIGVARVAIAFTFASGPGPQYASCVLSV